MYKEHPILFSTPMVQAILNGKKTMTRRVIKLPSKSQGWNLMFENHPDTMYKLAIEKCPYGQSGARLWVRETWAKISDWADVDPSVGLFDGYIYKADWQSDESPKWKPSIHMPRKAARIFLEVVSVRVGRVQETTEDDAISEGIRIGMGGMPYFSCKDAFKALWDSINAKRGYGWEVNPWVWVVDFKVLERTMDNVG